MDNQQNTPEELAALELYHQLANLSDETADRALLVTLRMPNGRYVGDVWLSKRDLEGLIDSSLGLAMMNTAHDQLDQMPTVLPEVDAEAVTDVVGGFEALLKAEGGDA